MTGMDVAARNHRPARGHPAFGWPGLRRRVQAARIARILLPGASAAGGFVSTELTVALPEGTVGRPDVAVVCQEPPGNGLVARAPELVVLIDHGGADERRAQGWLAMGVPVIWHLAGGALFERTPGLARRWMRGQVLRVAGAPTVTAAVEDLLDATMAQR
ncbi:MAG: hypothetical protein GEU81_10750 [Nitriliruptorales bacterium]|nr:hypothetical protein [Nitriliruptorales bacterium]